jgi:hypothetical protein
MATTYRIEFGRLGDGYPVPAATITATDINDLQGQIVAHAKPHLAPVLAGMGHPEMADCVFAATVPARTAVAA